MIKKIVLSFMFIFMIIAVILSTMGIHQVDLSDNFLAFLKQTARDSESLNLNIPTIPRIVLDEDTSGILKALVSVVNALSMIINVLIMVVNFITNLFVYVFMLIRNIATLIGSDFLIQNSAYAIA